MIMIVSIAHADADGVISTALFLKKFSAQKIYFTSAAKFKDTICSSIIGNENLNELYVFDIAPNEKTFLLSSLYEKVFWFDHHVWQVKSKFKNIKVFVDEKAKSCSEIVSKVFGIESELVDLANQIDVNEVKTEEAKFLRDLIGAIRWKYSGALLVSKLRAVAKSLSSHGIEKFEQDEKFAELINSFNSFCEKVEKEVEKRIKIFEMNGKKVAVYETMENVPIFLIANKLAQHPNKPFDVIAVIMHRLNFLTKKISTKIELRTQTQQDVYEIAKFFGGGGHKQAAGATINEFLTSDKLLEVLRGFL
jgi:oligoribonuclease NrnB/cAMP/cGMP phosphodiesterase (DHH superfamily)